MTSNLDSLRSEIRKVDEEILCFLRQRLQLAQQIGQLKKESGLNVVDFTVEKAVVDRAVGFGKELGLREDFARKMINLLISESVQAQVGQTHDRAAYVYDLFDLAEELEARGEKVIRLEIGEPDFASPPEVVNAAKESLNDEAMIKYGSSKGLEELRRAIANDICQEFDVEIDLNQILITPGANFSIFAGVLSLISPLDRVLIVDPSWPLYQKCVEFAGGRADHISTHLDEDWRINSHEVEEAFNAGTKLLILNNPSNPTGRILPSKELTELIDLAEEKGTYIISDEVYSSFAFAPFRSILEFSSANFIYVNSFSKKYGMTGWRIGYAVSDKKTISKMQQVIQATVSCVSGFVQKAALKAITMKKEGYKAFVREIKSRIEIACKELNGLPLSYTKPEGGMYIFPRIEIEGINSKEFSSKLFSEKKVAVTPGEAFGDYQEHFRISLTTNRADIINGIRLIGEVLKKCP